MILAMANPTPEIMPEEAKAVRPDAIIGTGRSDYPNQVNNVLCFPFIFRGALDVGATTINEAMKLATRARAGRPGACRDSGRSGQRLRRRGAALRSRIPDPQAVRPAPDRRASPRPWRRPRWIAASRRARSATSRPIARSCRRFVYQSGSTMEPVFAAAKKAPRRLIYAEGEDERVLRAVQVVVDEGLAQSPS